MRVQHRQVGSGMWVMLDVVDEDDGDSDGDEFSVKK